MSAPPTAASPLEALKAGFRRACVRRLVGDENGAIEVLKNEIPLLVVGWAKSTSLEPAEKKAKLKEMFDDESARADELATAFDLFAGSNFNLLFAAAAEYLIMPKASINDLPKGNANLIPLIVKLSKAL